MFSYRQMICNRGTLNGRISRFGGKAGVLRSIYQEAVQIVALRRWSLVVRPRPTTNDSRPEALLRFQIHGLHWQIPVGIENFEAALLFVYVGFFIGE